MKLQTVMKSILACKLTYLYIAIAIVCMSVHMIENYLIMPNIAIAFINRKLR